MDILLIKLFTFLKLIGFSNVLDGKSVGCHLQPCKAGSHLGV